MTHFAGQWLGAQSVADINKYLSTFPQLTSALLYAVHTELDLWMYFLTPAAHSPRFFWPTTPIPMPPWRSFMVLAALVAAARKSTPVASAVVFWIWQRCWQVTLNSTKPLPLSEVSSRVNLLCQELPPPPPGLNAIPPPLDPNLPTQDRVAAHRSDPSCQNCHQFIDPVGFSFERYDGIGAHRTPENGASVDDCGSLLGLVKRTDTEVTDSFGTRQLAQILATSTIGPACFTKQYEVYVPGNAHQNECTVQNVVRAGVIKGMPCLNSGWGRFQPNPS